jgi:tungstate transport system substrate-binding protein
VATLALSLLILLSPSAHAQEVLRLRLGTAIIGSGISKVLLPAFTEDSDIVVDLSASGSGLSLRDARSGAIDVLFINAPDAEKAFMADGAGIIRKPVMSDHYVIVGPAGDPADVANAPNAEDAFRRIARTQSNFVSRADDSGNNQEELSIWGKAGIEPFGDWYYETGLGVIQSLATAADRGAYMLVDWATWLQAGASGKNHLKLVFDGSKTMPDVFSVIAVNPASHPAVNLARARSFIDWLTSEPAQELIRQYEINGEHPYTPAIDEGD